MVLAVIYHIGRRLIAISKAAAKTSRERGRRGKAFMISAYSSWHNAVIECELVRIARGNEDGATLFLGKLIADDSLVCASNVR